MGKHTAYARTFYHRPDKPVWYSLIRPTDGITAEDALRRSGMNDIRLEPISGKFETNAKAVVNPRNKAVKFVGPKFKLLTYLDCCQMIDRESPLRSPKTVAYTTDGGGIVVTQSVDRCMVGNYPFLLYAVVDYPATLNRNATLSYVGFSETGYMTFPLSGVHALERISVLRTGDFFSGLSEALREFFKDTAGVASAFRYSLEKLQRAERDAEQIRSILEAIYPEPDKPQKFARIAGEIQPRSATHYLKLVDETHFARTSIDSILNGDDGRYILNPRTRHSALGVLLGVSEYENHRRGTLLDCAYSTINGPRADAIRRTYRMLKNV